MEKLSLEFPWRSLTGVASGIICTYWHLARTTRSKQVQRSKYKNGGVDEGGECSFISCRMAIEHDSHGRSSSIDQQYSLPLGDLPDVRSVQGTRT